jgi:hypothetical protein
MLTSLQKPTSILTVNGSAAFGHPSRHLAERYLLKGGLHACHTNSKYALTAGRSDHALIWEIVAAMLSPKALENDMDVLTTIGRPPPLRSQRTLYSSSDQGILPRDMTILKDLLVTELQSLTFMIVDCERQVFCFGGCTRGSIDRNPTSHSC